MNAGNATPVSDLNGGPTGWYARNMAGDAAWRSVCDVLLFTESLLRVVLVSTKSRPRTMVQMYATSFAIDNSTVEGIDRTEYVGYEEPKCVNA